MPARKRAAEIKSASGRSAKKQKTQSSTESRATRRNTRSSIKSEPVTGSGPSKKEPNCKASPAGGGKKATETKVENSSPAAETPKRKKLTTAPSLSDANGERADGEVGYWLMKAEPNSRLENGVDVKFSIDDLAAKSEPETWDGIRNHVAKNNILAMRKGDLAFFYHSNCKVPAIVGIMEIVGEAIVDGKDPASMKGSIFNTLHRNSVGSKVALL